ncbi:proteasomal ATPase-associated factor 1 [Rhinophrynus dorsalis]
MTARLFIQSDWDQVLGKAEGEAWVSCKTEGKPTIYGSLRCQGIGPNGTPEISASEKFDVLEITKRSITVSCPEENISYKFVSPYTSFSKIHKKNVTFLDVSCGGGLGVSTSYDETMKIWQTDNGDIRRVLEGHIGEVYCCKFFPSGKVVLSGGSDHQLKIWSVDDGSCPATLKGHKAAILSLDIVDRGRNVVSGSRDGTARLWDCGKSACISVVEDCYVPINAVAVGAVDNTVDLGSPKEAPSDREIGTEGKLLLLAREDNTLQGVSLHSRDTVFLFEGTEPLNCCAFLSSVSVLTGGQDGKIFHLDVRNTKTPVQIVCRSESPVLSLVPFRDGYISSQGKGTYFINPQDSSQFVELTGQDLEPAFQAATWEKSVYTCCRDGIIRKYHLADL